MPEPIPPPEAFIVEERQVWTRWPDDETDPFYATLECDGAVCAWCGGAVTGRDQALGNYATMAEPDDESGDPARYKVGHHQCGLDAGWERV